MSTLPKIIHTWFKVPPALHLRCVHRVKRPRATVLFIHGLGNTGAAWDEVIERLPHDIQVYSIDLLGFGNSPHPEWAKYDAKSQAQSLAMTLLKLRNRRKLTVVGHSLGGLIGIELARRYKGLVKGLLLCSPPLYDTSTEKKLLPRGDVLLRDVYDKMMARPDKFLALSAFAMKYNLANKTFNVTAKNFDSYRRTLKAAIVNQTSFEDCKHLTLPIRIITGKLDPLVITKNIRTVAHLNTHIHAVSILSGHEVKGRYVTAVLEQLEQLLNEETKSKQTRA